MSVADRPSSAPLVVLEALALGTFGLFVGLLLGSLSVSLLADGLGVGYQTPVGNAVSTTTQGIGLVLAGLLYLTRYDLPLSYLRIRAPSRRDAVVTVAATVALLAVGTGLVQVASWLGLPTTDHSVVEAAADSPEILLPLIPLSLLVTGPAEELLYRGVVQTRVRESFDAVGAVAVAAAIFAVSHVPAYGLGGNVGLGLVTTLAVLLVLGAFLGALYEYTGTLVVPAVTHGLYNAAVFANQYLAVTGGL